MPTEQLLLRGTSGLVHGEIFPIRKGQTVIIGRSRGCDICLKRIKRYMDLPENERDKDKDFLSVSRRHIRLTFQDAARVELEDLSANGTYLDGKKMEQTVVLSDLSSVVHELMLGPREKFRLEYVAGDG